jgi:hypothetical protein
LGLGAPSGTAAPGWTIRAIRAIAYQEFSSHRVRWLVFAAEKVLFDVTTKNQKPKPTMAIRLTTGRPKTRAALRAAPNLKI